MLNDFFPAALAASAADPCGRLIKAMVAGSVDGLPQVQRSMAMPGRLVSGASAGVIPIKGLIAEVPPEWEDYGFCSISRVRRDLVDMQTAGVQMIVLDIDSPGGAVTGVQELAERIEMAEGFADVVAWTGGTMASAAYWLAAGAGLVLAAPSAMVGSVGTIWPAASWAGYYEEMGVVDETRTSKGAEAKARYGLAHKWTDQDRADVDRVLAEAAAPMVEFITRRRGVVVPAGLVWQAGKAPRGVVDMTRFNNLAIDTLERVLGVL